MAMATATATTKTTANGREKTSACSACCCGIGEKGRDGHGQRVSVESGIVGGGPPPVGGRVGAGGQRRRRASTGMQRGSGEHSPCRLVATTERGDSRGKSYPAKSKKYGRVRENSPTSALRAHPGAVTPWTKLHYNYRR